MDESDHHNNEHATERPTERDLAFYSIRCNESVTCYAGTLYPWLLVLVLVLVLVVEGLPCEGSGRACIEVICSCF